MDMRDVAKMMQRIAPPQNDSLPDLTNVY
jgi:hypothetical protein